MKLLSILVLMLVVTAAQAQKEFTLKSLDGKVEAPISVGDIVEYSVLGAGDIMLAKSPLSMTLEDGTLYGVKSKLGKASTKAVNEKINATIYKKKEVINSYNEL
ncbi:MAG: glycoside hydrolase family 97 N-terminal domain-containing protein [Prevotellaceae bacterium]|nr:glycoside hydrolase family 97 N-terminal domain-containing protein [Prevotellaceae bacterium]